MMMIIVRFQLRTTIFWWNEKRDEKYSHISWIRLQICKSELLCSGSQWNCCHVYLFFAIQVWCFSNAPYLPICFLCVTCLEINGTSPAIIPIWHLGWAKARHAIIWRTRFKKNTKNVRNNNSQEKLFICRTLCWLKTIPFSYFHSTLPPLWISAQTFTWHTTCFIDFTYKEKSWFERRGLLLSSSRLFNASKSSCV